MRVLRVIFTLGAAFAIVAGVAYGGFYLMKRFGPVEQTLAGLKAMPLIGLVVSDVPGAEARLRKAIEEELAQPTVQGPLKPQIVLGELRREFITPALRSADDASVIVALASRAELVAHLLKTNTPACREFATIGIQRVDKLDEQGQILFRNVLAAVEAAYRNGRATGKPLPMPTGPEFADLLREAGFQKADFDRLNNFGALSNEVTCESQLKLEAAPTQLPAAKRGPFARFVLGN